MARPEQTPAPQYEGLPYGANMFANEMSQDIPEDADELFDEEAEDYQPTNPDEEFLFSPTDRPGEPLTAGMQFGAGPDFTRRAIETDTQFRMRVSESLAANPDKDVQAFRAALDRGL